MLQLPPPERAVLLALLRRGGATAADVCAECGIESTAAAEALLHGLANRGLAEPGEGPGGARWLARLGRRAPRRLPDQVLEAAYRSLRDAFEAEGEGVVLTGDRPLPLQDAGAVWLVTDGQVHVFAVALRDGVAVGARTHLCTVATGGLLPGVDTASGDTGLLAVAAREARLQRLAQTRWRELARGHLAPLAAAALGGWLAGLVAAVRAGPAPRGAPELESGPSTPAGTVARRPGTDPFWVRATAGQAHLLGRSELPLTTEGLPVPAAAWLRCAPDAHLNAIPLVEWLAGSRAWDDLAQAQRALLIALGADRGAAAEDRRRRAAERQGSAAAALHGGTLRLGALLAPAAATPGVPPAEALGAAFAAVVRHIGLTVPRVGRSGTDIPALAAAHRLRARPVTLRAGWWRHDHGPLLARRQEGGQPVALLPRRDGYRIEDPVTGTAAAVTAAVAATLNPVAWTPYRPLPERRLRSADLVTFVWPLLRPDLPTFLLGGLAAALLGTAVPVLTGVLVGAVIPDGDRLQLAVLAGALLAVALTTTCLSLPQRISLLRAQGRVGAALQAAVWDRLLALPPTFFREQAAGDLAQRAMALDTLVETVGGAPAFALWGAVLAACSGAVMFYYDGALALAAVGLVALGTAFLLGGAAYAGRYWRRAYTAAGRVGGTVLQLLVGMPKLRAAGAARYAFAKWAQGYAVQREETLRAGAAEVALQAFTAAFPTVTLSVILALLVAHGLPPALPISRFLAWNAAFGQLLAAVLLAGPALVQISSALALYDRVRPILDTAPEVAPTRGDPGELVGALDCHRVSFRYTPETPPVLSDVSFSAAPGEFIALVGPSGSGKSTLLRLLLGFEQPESGAVLFDRQDLARLDLRAVRRQIGVVLQGSRLIAGTIYENIAGGMRVTTDEAREAARQAGLEPDLDQMPMGLYTYVVDGGTTLSGGQRQKVLLARALVKRPRILLLDEATSALDNRTQDVVRRSLDALRATRIVIAHRLSTIRRANRIYVLEGGRVVQAGTYEDLLRADGAFGRLARRQLLGEPARAGAPEANPR